MSESLITKKAIAQSFKDVMQQKNFDKISVNDITNACGLNRQTFYYHFEDKYDLMNWIYYQEIFLPMVDDLNQHDYDKAFLQMFSKMKGEQVFYQNALSMSAEYGFRDYLFSILEELMTWMLEGIKKTSMQARFYAYGLLGVIIDWINQGMKISPQVFTQHIMEILLDIKRKFEKTIP